MTGPVYVRTDAGDTRELTLTSLGWLDSLGGTWVRRGKAWRRAETYSTMTAVEVDAPFRVTT